MKETQTQKNKETKEEGKNRKKVRVRKRGKGIRRLYPAKIPTLHYKVLLEVFVCRSSNNKYSSKMLPCLNANAMGQHAS